MSNSEILDKLTTSVKKYDVIVIYGPAGCGKTFQLKSWGSFSEYEYITPTLTSPLSEDKKLIIDQIDKSWLIANLDTLIQAKSKVILISNENLYSVLSTKLRFKVLHLFELQSAHEVCEFSRLEGYVEQISQDLCHSLLVKFNGNQKRIVQFFEYVNSFNLSYNRRSIDLFTDYLGIEKSTPHIAKKDQNFIRSVSMLYPFTSIHRFDGYQTQLNELLDQGLLYVHNNFVRLKFELPSLESENGLDFDDFFSDFCSFLSSSSEHYLSDFLNLYSLCLQKQDYSALFTIWDEFNETIILDKRSLLSFYRPFKRQGNKLKLLEIKNLELYLILAFHCESDSLINYTATDKSVTLLDILGHLDSKNLLGLLEKITNTDVAENIKLYLYFELLGLLIEEGSISQAQDLVIILSQINLVKRSYNQNYLQFFKAKLKRIQGNVSAAKKDLVCVFQNFEDSNYSHESYLSLVQIAYCNLYLLDFKKLNNTIEILQSHYPHLNLKQDYFEYRLLAYKKAFEFDFHAAQELITEAYFEYGSHIKNEQETLYFCELLLFELMAGNLEKIEAYLFRISLDESKKVTNIGYFLKGLYLLSTSSYGEALKLLKKCDFYEVNVGIYHTRLLVSYFISLCEDKLNLKSDFDSIKREIFRDISFEAQIFYLKSLECFEVGLSTDSLQYYFERSGSKTVLTNSRKKELKLDAFDMVIDTCQDVYSFNDQALDFSNNQKVLKLLIVFLMNQDKGLDSNEIVRHWYNKTICNESDLNNFRVSLSRLRNHLNDSDKDVIVSTKKGRVSHYQLNQNLKALLICGQGALDEP